MCRSIYSYTQNISTCAGVYIMGTKYGLRAHSMDRIYLRAQSTNSRTIHGLRCVRKQLIAWFARKSSPRINYRSQV